MSNDPTNAERQARWRAKRHKQQAALEAELQTLRNRGATAKAGADTQDKIAVLRRVIAEVEQQRDAALAEGTNMRKNILDSHHVIAEAKAILAVKAFMPAEVFKTLLYSAHEDRVADPKWKARYRTAFQFLKDHERMLAKKPLPPRPPGLPRTPDEWTMAKWRAAKPFADTHCRA